MNAVENSRLDDIEQLKSQYLNHEFEIQDFEVSADSIVAFARACGETAERYLDPAHSDFQAPPTFSSCFARGRNLPEGFPLFGGMAMDGGKDVVPLKPIRPGVTLTGRTHVHDVYTKTGRSGRMIFVVSRMELFDPAGEQVSTADTRLVIREKLEQ